MAHSGNYNLADNDEPEDLLPRWELARTIAREAGQATLQYFRRPDLQIERKADESPVTVADRQAERLLRERISAAFPDDAILGEEMGATDGSSPYRWVVDPIDGTKGFLRGHQYAIALGLIADGQVVLGVLGCPNLPVTATEPEGQRGRLFVAVQGGGAFTRPIEDAAETPIAVATVDNPAQATFTESVESATPGRFIPLPFSRTPPPTARVQTTSSRISSTASSIRPSTKRIWSPG